MRRNSTGERKFMERAVRRHTMSTKAVPAQAHGGAAAGAGHHSNQLRTDSLRVEISDDGSTVRWSEQDISDDSGCVRSTFPVPRDATHFCFEVNIVHGDDIALGLSAFDADGKRLVDTSCVYSGKTGQAKANSNIRKYATFKTGDLITCGVSFFGHSAEPFIFFAVNGEVLEPFLPWRGHKSSEMYAFVSSASPSALVKVCFDETLQTKWGSILREIERERERKRYEKIKEEVDLEPVCERVVRDFLLHYGYVNTLRAMDGIPPSSSSINGASYVGEEEDTMDVEKEPVTSNSSSSNKGTPSSSSPSTTASPGTTTPSVSSKKRLQPQQKDVDMEEEEDVSSKRNGFKKPIKSPSTTASKQEPVVMVQPESSSSSSSSSKKKRGFDVLDGNHHHHQSTGSKALALAAERRKVRALVLEGHPVEAMRVVEEKWPDVLASSPVGLDLRIQCLVELIMARQDREAIALARAELWPYLKQDLDEDREDEAEDAAILPESAEAALVKRALGLFALPDLESESAKAKLSLFDRKRAVADSLNRVLLFHPNPPRNPAIERILTRLSEYQAMARERAGGYGSITEQDEVQ